MIFDILCSLLFFHGPQKKEKDVKQGVKDCLNNAPGFETKFKDITVCELVEVSERTLKNPVCRYMRQGTYLQHEAGRKYHVCDRGKCPENNYEGISRRDLPYPRFNWLGQGEDRDFM